MAAITDLLDRVTDSTTGRPVISALAAPGKAIAAASLNITDATNWTTTTAIHFSIYKTASIGGVLVKDPTTQTDWKGTLAGTTISNLTLTGGTDRAYAAGDIIEITPTARWAKDLYDLLITLFNQDASLKPAPIQTALGLGASTLNGWNALGFAPNTVTALGNRSYSLVFNSTDLTATLSVGTRLRLTRNTAAPNQCSSLNGTNQNWSKAAPAAMTFVNNFTTSAWVKIPVYADGGVISRYNGTSGWILEIGPNGNVLLTGLNAGAANFSRVAGSQAIPLNRWVHIAAQLDMATFTATPTTSYVMIDGLDTPATVSRGGTNPVALIQAGNLEVGSYNGGGFFNGKLAQVAVYNAKVTQATILASINQTLAGTETSLISAYSLSGNANDLNTTSANNLTAGGGATTSTADAPYGGQAGGTISTTLDYGVIMGITFSTNTTVIVQLPEGCTIPTSGTVASVAYSANKAPYGMPVGRHKWWILWISKVGNTQAAPVSGTWYNINAYQIVVPQGEWNIRYSIEVAPTAASSSTANYAVQFCTLSTANNSESDPTSTAITYCNVITSYGIMNAREYLLSLAAQTTYFLNHKTNNAGTNNLSIGSDVLSYIIIEPAHI